MTELIYLIPDLPVASIREGLQDVKTAIGLDQQPTGNGTAEGEEEVLLSTKVEESLQLDGKPAAFELPVDAFSNLTKVPDEFVIQDPNEAPNRQWGENDESNPDFEFPILDMSPLMTQPGDEKQQPESSETDRRELIEAIGKACEQWGFFQAINSGVSLELLDRVIEVGHDFFHLPLEEKQVRAASRGNFEGYGRLDFRSDGVRFWGDTLHHHVRPLTSVKDDKVPRKPADYRSVIEEYAQGVEKLTEVVQQGLSIYLGLKPDALREAHQGDMHLVMGYNYCPKCPEPEKVLGLGAHKDFGTLTVMMQDERGGAHKDFGTLTVMMQDERGGLQVQKRGSPLWLDVKPKKGTVIVQVANQVELSMAISNNWHNLFQG